MGLVACGLPPVEGFPSLPQPLRWYLGVRARQFSRSLEEQVRGDPGCRYLGLGFTRDASLMASDGFRPGPGVYALWARHVVDLLEEVLGKGPRPVG